MRFAIFSDIHANRQAWDAVLMDAQRQRAETLICLGDVVGYGPKPQEVLSSIRAATANFVLGNHDAAACGRLDPAIFNDRAREVIEWTRARLDADAQEFLQQVPMQMDGPGLLFVHAEVVEPGEFGYIDGLAAAEPNLRAMSVPLAFIGHTHLPMAFVMPKKGGQVTQKPPVDFKIERGKRYIVNVGSVGEPRTTDVRASYVIYDDATKTVSFRKVEFDVDGYIGDLDETGLDIKPYFIRVVEAGKYSKPPPTAAPQLALTHLPKITETVDGHHGSMVVGRRGGLGRPGAMPMPGGRPLGSMAPPKQAKPAMAICLVLLVLISIAVVIWLTMADRGRPLAGNDEPAGGKRVLRVVKPSAPAAPAPVIRESQDLVSDATLDRTMPIKFLNVKVYRKEFESLEDLRKAETQGDTVEEKAVNDGVLSLDVAGQPENFGLIWEGFLIAPETGEYTFTLDSDDGSALFVDEFEIAKVGGTGEKGRKQSGSVRLARGSATPFRLEYFQRQGERGLELSWSGKGLQEGESLVRKALSGGLAETPVAANKEAKAAPEAPAAPPKRSATLSNGLAAYWSLDHRDDGGGRFTKRDDGQVEERLISATGSKVQVFVPEGGFPKDWTQVGCDASGWKQGWNGVGYETEGRRLERHIQTVIGKEPGQHPFSVLVRIPFTVDDPKSYTKLVLQARFSGGFAAYINGEFVGAEHAPAPSTLRWNSRALAARRGAAVTEWRYLPANKILTLGKLSAGTNVLAIHALNYGGSPGSTNRGCSSPAFLIQAELLGLRPDQAGLPEEERRSARDLGIPEKAFTGNVKRAEGKFGDSYNFVKGHLRIGDKEQYAIGDGPFTVSIWFTRDPQGLDGQSRRFLSAGSVTKAEPGWGLYLSNGRNPGSLAFVLGNGKDQEKIRGNRGKLADGNWHHVAVTVEKPSRRVKIYIDGTLAGNQVSKVLQGGPIANHTGLSLGGPVDDRLRHRGKLDDVAIWNRALAPAEIAEIYKKGLPLGEIFNREEN